MAAAPPVPPDRPAPVRAAPAPAAGLSEPGVSSQQVRINRGDTLMRLLVRNQVTRPKAHAVVAALQPLYDVRRIKPGQSFTLIFASDHRADRDLVGLSFRPSGERDIRIFPDGEDGYLAQVVERPLVGQDTLRAGTISSSLYEAAEGAGLPVEVLIRLVAMFSYDVDFQRDLQPGDGFTVLYQDDVDREGAVVRHGPILYGALTLSGQTREYFRRLDDDGAVDYFDRAGKGARKSLMRTPIRGARLSSGYGRRRHPILGYNKLHRGVDFAAPRGTPILAAGDGRIAKIGRHATYGRYIRIRHNRDYSTLYAHMYRFAKGMRRGVRVKQGQVIGKVGSTGRSTGPHLHYEVIEKGRRINPMRLRLTAAETLKGQELAEFQQLIAAIDRRVAAAAKAGRTVAWLPDY